MNVTFDDISVSGLLLSAVEKLFPVLLFCFCFSFQPLMVVLGVGFWLFTLPT
jgi:hypothetical protein